MLLGPSSYYDLVQMVKVSSLQSDHCAILTSFQDLCYTPKPYVPTFINSKSNWSLFREILNEVDFSFVSPNYDINAIESNLRSILLESAKLAIPMTRVRFYNGSKRPKNLWNDECRVAVLAKRKARKMFQKHPSQSTAIFYKQSCAKVKLICRRAKQSTWLNFSSNISFRTPISKVHNFISIVESSLMMTVDMISFRIDIQLYQIKRRQICLPMFLKTIAQIFIPADLLFVISFLPVLIRLL